MRRVRLILTHQNRGHPFDPRYPRSIPLVTHHLPTIASAAAAEIAAAAEPAEAATAVTTAAPA